jgi:hypothetical protein
MPRFCGIKRDTEENVSGLFNIEYEYGKNFRRCVVRTEDSLYWIGLGFEFSLEKHEDNALEVLGLGVISHDPVLIKLLKAEKWWEKDDDYEDEDGFAKYCLKGKASIQSGPREQDDAIAVFNALPELIPPTILTYVMENPSSPRSLVHDIPPEREIGIPLGQIIKPFEKGCE